MGWDVLYTNTHKRVITSASQQSLCGYSAPDQPTSLSSRVIPFLSYTIAVQQTQHSSQPFNQILWIQYPTERARSLRETVVYGEALVHSEVGYDTVIMCTSRCRRRIIIIINTTDKEKGMSGKRNKSECNTVYIVYRSSAHSCAQHTSVKER